MCAFSLVSVDAHVLKYDEEKEEWHTPFWGELILNLGARGCSQRTADRWVFWHCILVEGAQELDASNSSQHETVGDDP